MADLDLSVKRGALSVALTRVMWQRHCDLDASSLPQPLWVVVQLAGLERFWFPPDDDNARTVSVTTPEDAIDRDAGNFEYQQSSKALPLTRDTVEALCSAQLQLLVFCGDSRARETDALLGELQLPLVGVVLGESLEQHVVVPLAHTAATATETVSAATDRHIEIDVCVQLDANTADFVTGCRVLGFRALSMLSLPNEWTLPSESDDDALRLCVSPDRNVAAYELEIHLPDVATQAAAEAAAVDLIVVSGGKLQYELSNESRVTETGEADEQEETGAPMGLTGAWRVAFPETAALTRVYLKVRACASWALCPS